MRTVILLIALAAVACAQPIFGGGGGASIFKPRGATLPASCAVDGLVYVLTADDGGNARGSYVCLNGTYTSMTAAGGEGSYTLPTAAADTLGGIKIGTGLSITDGVASVGTLNQNTTGNAATATALAANGANCSAGQYPLGVNASGAVEDCTTPAVGVKLADPDTATASSTIEIVAGTNITASKSCAAGKCAVTVNNSQAAYTLPTAAADTLGGVKVGSGLTITDGVLAASGGSSTSYLSFPAANCQLGAAATGFALPATNYPTATCVTGTNTIYGVLSFANNASGAAQSIQTTVALSGTISSIDVTGKWRTSAVEGDVAWQIQTACVADAETGDPSFNAAQEIADTAKGTTLQHNTFSLTGLTLTGCATGETLFLKFYRDADDAQDTLAATAELISLGLTINR